eukprot:maker-scaffold171_size289870-snap-gene-0.8 protein:Tk00421 transcript:maker-scaffold171_size289870-snap-gene-0.8-mRNA-1 annotation:"wash complex subunit ccdc53 isoform x1"
MVDRTNGPVLQISIEPSDGLLKVTSSLTPSRVTELSISLDFGDPFTLRVDYEPAKFRFKFNLDGEDIGFHAIPNGIPDLELVQTDLEGSWETNFVGFINRTMSHTIPVGSKITYVCPEGFVFAHNWFQQPKTVLTCFDTGLFNAPQTWSNCIR